MKPLDMISTSLALVLLSACPAFALNVPDATFTTKNVGKVVFSHNFHIRQKVVGNNCQACHNAIFEMRKKVRYTMADMAKGKSCGACHNGTTAFGLNKCVACHTVRDVVFRIKETGPVTFRHRLHTRNTLCTACHSRLYAAGPNKRVGMAQMAKGKSCGACHNGKNSFALSRCTGCHPVRELTYQVRETGPVRFSHRSHLAMYQCGECHVKLYTAGPNKRVGMTQMKKGQSCGACHDGKTAFAVGDCTRCHPVRDVKFAEKSAGDVTFSHTVHLGMYSCGECHPAIYSPGKAPRGITMAAMNEGKSCGACHDGKTAFAARGECDKCHRS
jgi:c(7)-type cytochrome triheme protein